MEKIAVFFILSNKRHGSSAKQNKKLSKMITFLDGNIFFQSILNHIQCRVIIKEIVLSIPNTSHFRTLRATVLATVMQFNQVVECGESVNSAH